MEVDENGHKDRNIGCEIKTEKAVKKELDCQFIRTNPDRKFMMSMLNH